MGGSEYEQHVQQVLYHMAEFYRLIDTTDSDGSIPFYLPEGIVKRLQHHVDEFLSAYSWLTSYSLRAGARQWNIVPKFHYF